MIAHVVINLSLSPKKEFRILGNLAFSLHQRLNVTLDANVSIYSVRSSELNVNEYLLVLCSRPSQLQRNEHRLPFTNLHEAQLGKIHRHCK